MAGQRVDGEYGERKINRQKKRKKKKLPPSADAANSLPLSRRPTTRPKPHSHTNVIVI
jgi:hypothetical protein